MGRVCCGCCALAASTFKRRALTSIRRALNIGQPRGHPPTLPAVGKPQRSLRAQGVFSSLFVQGAAGALRAAYMPAGRGANRNQNLGCWHQARAPGQDRGEARRSSAREVARGHRRDRKRAHTLRTHGPLPSPFLELLREEGGPERGPRLWLIFCSM